MKITVIERFTYLCLALPPIIFAATILYIVSNQQEVEQKKSHIILNTIKNSTFSGIAGKNLLVQDIVRYDNNCWKLNTSYQTKNVYLTYCLDKKNAAVLKNIVYEDIVAYFDY